MLALARLRANTEALLQRQASGGGGGVAMAVREFEPAPAHSSRSGALMGIGQVPYDDCPRVARRFTLSPPNAFFFVTVGRGVGWRGALDAGVETRRSCSSCRSARRTRAAPRRPWSSGGSYWRPHLRPGSG
jgi:hypothetical protein